MQPHPKKQVPVHTTGKSPDQDKTKLVTTVHKSPEKKIVSGTTMVIKEGECSDAHPIYTTSKKTSATFEASSYELGSESHRSGNKLLGSPSQNLKKILGNPRDSAEERKKSTITKGTEGSEAKTGSNKYMTGRKSSSPIVGLETHTFRDAAEKLKPPASTTTKPIPHYMLPTKRTQPEPSSEQLDQITSRTTKDSIAHKESGHKTIAAARSPPREAPNTILHPSIHHATGVHKGAILPPKPPVPATKELLHKEPAVHYAHVTIETITIKETSTSVHKETVSGPLSSSRTDAHKPLEKLVSPKASSRTTGLLSPPRKPPTPEKHHTKPFAGTHKAPDKLTGVKTDRTDKSSAAPVKLEHAPVDSKDKYTPLKTTPKGYQKLDLVQKALPIDQASSSTNAEEKHSAQASVVEEHRHYQDLALDDPRLKSHHGRDEGSAAVVLPSFTGIEMIECTDDIFSGDEGAKSLNKLSETFNTIFKKYYGIEIFASVEGQVACEAAREKVHRPSKSRPRLMTSTTQNEQNNIRTTTLSPSPTKKPVQLKPAIVIPEEKLFKGPTSNPLGNFIVSNSAIPPMTPSTQNSLKNSVLAISSQKDRIDQNFPKPYNLCDKADLVSTPIIAPIYVTPEPKSERVPSGRMNTADMKDLIRELNLESIELILQEQDLKEEAALRTLEAAKESESSSRAGLESEENNLSPENEEGRRNAIKEANTLEDNEDEFDLDREYRKIVQGEHTPNPKHHKVKKASEDVEKESEESKEQKPVVIVSHLNNPTEGLKKCGPKPTPIMVELGGELHNETHVMLNASFGETFETPTTLTERQHKDSPILEGLTPMVRELGHEESEKSEEHKTKLTDKKGGFSIKVNLVAPKSPLVTAEVFQPTYRIEVTDAPFNTSAEKSKKSGSGPVIEHEVLGSPDTIFEKYPVLETHSHKVVPPQSHPVIEISIVDKVLPHVPVVAQTNNTKVDSLSAQKLHKVGSQEKLVKDIRHHLIEGEKNISRGHMECGLVGVHTGPSIVFESSSMVGESINQDRGVNHQESKEDKDSKLAVVGGSSKESLKLNPTIIAKIQNHEILTPHAAGVRMGTTEKQIPHIDPHSNSQEQFHETIVKESLQEKKPEMLPTSGELNHPKSKYMRQQPSHSLSNISRDENSQTPAPLTPRRLTHDQPLVSQQGVQMEKAEELMDDIEKPNNLSPLSGSAYFPQSHHKRNIRGSPGCEIRYIPRTDEDLPAMSFPGIGPTDNLEEVENFTIDHLDPQVTADISKKMVDILFGSDMGSVGPVFELSSQSNFAKGAKDSHPVLNQLGQQGMYSQDFVPIESAGGRGLPHGQSKYGGIEEDLPPITEERTGDENLPTLAEIINNDANLQFMEEKSRTFDSSRYRNSQGTPRVAIMSILGLSPKEAPPLDMKRRLEDPFEQKSKWRLTKISFKIL